MLQQLESKGISLAVIGENKLQVTGEISDKERYFIKTNKLYLMAALKLRAMAPAADQPGLLKWCKDDYEMITSMGLDQLQYLVDNFLTNQGSYS